MRRDFMRVMKAGMLELICMRLGHKLWMGSFPFSIAFSLFRDLHYAFLLAVNKWFGGGESRISKMANYGNAWAAVKAMSWNGQKGVVGSVCGDKLVPWLLQQLHAQVCRSNSAERATLLILSDLSPFWPQIKGIVIGKTGRKGVSN